MRKLTKKQQQAFLDELTAEAEALTGVVKHLDEEDEAWAKFNFSDQRSMDPLEGDMVTVQRAVLNQISQSNVAGSAEVSRALHKLAEGTYGVCDDCGKDIPLERLQARPRSVRCVNCA